MTPTALGKTWDEASTPDVLRLARRFEDAWRSSPDRRPDPSDLLPADPGSCPGALLALLRTDLALRFEAGESARVEGYRDRHPYLGDESLIALLYEEFCLRDESGERPDPAEYDARFPGVAARLREVLEIHSLIGAGPSLGSLDLSGIDEPPFPAAGQTIAGFTLVEELGRGAFARVFRARERQLADRPVVLKVARRGSREPQTLARLQHTHIVPIYSYRNDPATDLHLLCMPYLGRLTLGRVFADPGLRLVRSGDELALLLERHLSPEAAVRRVGLKALRARSYPRAVALWGARLAEGLHHAHERGVLHRDIKPSNILLTDDGQPMLLDFNLARDPGPDEAAGERLGGTLAYMAPEHLAAFVEGKPGRVDRRADVYALGMVLFEALTSKPHPHPADAPRSSDNLRWLLEVRRGPAPRLRDRLPHVPPELEAVLRRCLEPEPADRYATAGDLAADLQAVADDAPLRFACEPQPGRSIRWLRRNRRRLAVAAPALLGLAVLIVGGFRAQAERLRAESNARGAIREGERQLASDHPRDAAAQFADAARFAEGWPALRPLASQAGGLRREALAIAEARTLADRFADRADHLRYLLHFGRDLPATAREVRSALAPYGVLEGSDWIGGPLATRLDAARRDRLRDDVDDLLFLWAVTDLRAAASPSGAAARGALSFCGRALASTRHPEPWLWLRDWCAWRLGERPDDPPAPSAFGAESSPLACLHWSLIGGLLRRDDLRRRWAERAVLLREDDYWARFALTKCYEEIGEDDLALARADGAVALRGAAPWFRLNRAKLFVKKEVWWRARSDLDRALADAHRIGFEVAEARLERGLLHLALGEVSEARADFEAIAAAEPDGPLALAAGLNLARLDAGAGRMDAAFASVDDLVRRHPESADARLARALLGLQAGRPGVAEDELGDLLGRDLDRSTRAEALAARARARLALGRPAEAEADAGAAYRLDGRPARERLWRRAQLADGRLDPGAVRPADVERWPSGGPALQADLIGLADRSVPDPAGDGEASAEGWKVQAIALASAGLVEAALASADRAVELAGEPAEALILRAEIRLMAGDPTGARDDLRRAEPRRPDDPRLWELRGRADLAEGKAGPALADLEHAIALGAGASAFAAEAEALAALGRADRAIEAWTRALRHDPEDPAAYLRRARLFRRRGDSDSAVADLERALALSGAESPLRPEVLDEYRSCRPAPERARNPR